MAENIQSEVKRPMGLRNFHIAILKSDNGTEVTYENPVFVKGIENIQYSMKYAEGKGFSDDVQDTALKLATSCDITATFAQYLPKIASILQGNDITKGGKIVNSVDLQKKCAIMYEVVNSDGTITYKIFYKASLACDGETNNTKGENIDFAKFQLTGTAIPLSEGTLYREFNSSENLKDDLITNFYKKVILPSESILKV